MKKIIYALGIFLVGSLSNQSVAQTISNGDFESGAVSTQNSESGFYTASGGTWSYGCSQNYDAQTNSYFTGTPDYHDCASPYTFFNMPAANKLNPGPNGGCRFVGMLTPKSDLQRRESIRQFTGVWSDGFNYTLSMSVARVKTIPYADQPATRQMEAVLRKSGQCTAELVIPIYVDIPVLNNGQGDPSQATNNWMQISTSFSLSPADAAQNYDCIEIRPRHTSAVFYEKMYVDNVTLDKEVGSLAEVVPVNHNGVELMESIYGELDVYNFCIDEVVLDGSGSSNESSYRYQLVEFDLSTGTSVDVYNNTTWTSGTVPNNIDPSLGVYNLTPLPSGTVYMFKVYVGPQWHYDYVLFTVEECCPEELLLDVDCSEGIISIANLPSNATGLHTTWYFSKKTPASGYGQVIQSGAGTIASTSAVDPGYYTVVIQFELPGGMICEQVATIYFNPDDCCSPDDQFELQAWIDDNIIDYKTVTSQTYGWSVQVPIICDPDRIYNFATNHPCVDVYTIKNSTFNTNTWQDITTYYTDSGSGAVPAGITISGNEYVPGVVNHLQVAVASPYEVVDILWIPSCDPEVELPDFGADDKRRGIEFETSKIQISLAPNPTSENVSVSFEDAQTGTASVVSAEGKVVFSTNFENSASFDLNTAALPAGLYYINVTVDGQVLTEKLIKK